MADILLDNQASPATPAAGKTILFIETTGKRLTAKNDAGVTATLDGEIRNWNTADVVANAADTYLTGSGLVVPTGLALQPGTTFKWVFGVTKTGAGVATPVWTIRAGTAGSVADTARVTLTGLAQTAIADAAFIEIVAVLRNVGAAGVLAAVLSLEHNAGATGFANQAGGEVLQATSAGFDTTTAGMTLGVSVNPGASGVWTHQVITAEMAHI